MQFMFVVISTVISLCLVDKLVSLPNIHRSDLSLRERAKPLFTRRHWVKRFSLGTWWAFLLVVSQVFMGAYLIYESYDLLFVMEVLLVFTILWAATYTDAKHMIVPNLYILLGLLVYLLFLLLGFILDRAEAVDWIRTSLMGFGKMLIVVVLAYVLSRKQLGLGDVKLVLLLSLFIGWPDVLAFIFVGSVVMLGVAFAIIIFRRKRAKYRFPLAPIILVGAYLSVILLA